MIGKYSVWFQYYLAIERRKALFEGDLPRNIRCHLPRGAYISNRRWVQLMLRQSRGQGRTLRGKRCATLSNYR